MALHLRTQFPNRVLQGTHKPTHSRSHAALAPSLEPALCSEPSSFLCPGGPFLYLKTDHIASGQVTL